jgi:DNA-binding LytR/AlgR family response regulator
MVAWLNYPNHTDDASDNLLGLSFSSPLLQEYLNIVGPVTTAWALICLPRLHWLMPPLLHEPKTNNDAAAKPDTNKVALELTSNINSSNSAESPTPTRATWRDRLPEQLGTDVIAVTSELQYLRVWTPRGCALILGALADVESEAAATGLRVHRSWWVANEHVVSVRRTATGAVCLMSDGRQVPVSRRRRSEVLAHFGDGAQYRGNDASKAVSDTQLN